MCIEKVGKEGDTDGVDSLFIPRGLKILRDSTIRKQITGTTGLESVRKCSMEDGFNVIPTTSMLKPKTYAKIYAKTFPMLRIQIAGY